MVKIALGLGSNVGNRQQMIAQAVELLSAHMNVHKLSELLETPALLEKYAPAEWNQPFINAALTGETQLSAKDLLWLCHQIEGQLGRTKSGKWSPRTIDIDVLLYGENILQEADLTIPHPYMLQREFVMRPLIEIAGDWVHPITHKCLKHHQRTKIVGIVNVTPDSFSDGGQYFTPEAAIAHAQNLLKQGADFLDIGAESTRPNATLISPRDEWARLEPVLKAMPNKALLSVDTRHTSTAKRALDLGVGWINDVSGAADDTLVKAVAQFPDAKYVLMHSLTVPANKAVTLAKDSDLVSEISEFASLKIKQLLHLGLQQSQIIFDVGLGFGKTAAQSQELVKRMTEFNHLGVPLYVGHSRKSFLDLPISAAMDEKDAQTLNISQELAAKSIDYVRVHNVEIHRGL